MKVAVITRHAITNYGSLLQAFATEKIIESLGHECEIIDYIRIDETYSEVEKTLLSKKSEWNNNPLKKIIYLLLRQPESIIAGKRFEKERSKYLHLTKRYNSLDELTKDKPIADVYMTGSDQVWGPVSDGTFDSSYCLSFTDENDKRISYAASFGRVDFSKDLETHYSNWLSRYSHITVREESAAKNLNKIGIESEQVLDPTLLFTSDFWYQYTEPIKHKKYILVYQIHSDARVGKYVKLVSQKMGLPVIRISASLHQMSREGKLIFCPSIGKFLSYIKNATCLITDSFHGTAFAINFNIPFVEVLPNNNTETRNVSILNLTGLSDRILKDDNDIELATKKIDFKYVNEIIKQKREESINILKDMLEN